MNVYETIFNEVLQHFRGNTLVATKWMLISNPMLGGLCPAEMINLGRAVKLLQFIKGQTDDNAHPAPGRN